MYCHLQLQLDCQWESCRSLDQYLYKVVEHEASNTSPSPLRVGEDEGDVRLVVLDIRNHESKAYHKTPATNNKYYSTVIQCTTKQLILSLMV